MIKFKSKKLVLLSSIFTLMAVFICGLLQLFRLEDKNNNIVVDAAIDGVSVSGDWTASSDNLYTVSVSGGFLSSKSKTMTITVNDIGTLKCKYSNSSGSLTITSTGGASLSASGNVSSLTAIDIGLVAGTNTITVKCTAAAWGKASAEFQILEVDRSGGITGSSITEGFGTTASPYIIKTQQNLQDMNLAPTAVFSLANNITLSSAFTPIGSAEQPFSGTFLGNGYTISNLTMAAGTYRGLFGSTSGGKIEKLTLDNVNITKANTYSGMLIGYAVNGTVINDVNVSGSLKAVAGNVGGLVGYANGHSAVSATNCNVYGTVYCSAAGNVGGLSGAGGTFSNCVVYANVTGMQLVGGLTGGYKNDIGDLEKISGVNFGSYTNCYVAGDVAVIGNHSNNYPYWGLINGYGAFCKYTLSNVGQRIKFDFTSTQSVQEVRIFNSNVTQDGVVATVTQTESGYTFTQDVTLTQTFAGGSSNANALLNETAVTGITGNYGGLTIRFKMADGTYKYVSALNKEKSKFQSIFNVNLDDLTSYVDNFANIEIDTSKGTGSYTTSSSISVWGTAKIYNANDFEHLAWIINGAIPTTFANSIKYNARSVATLSIALYGDIDLTAERKDGNNKILNRDSKGNIIKNFYGLGKTEMYPYRGSIYGNNHSLTVNMDFPDAYLMGIICVATDQENQITIENLTVNGTISGRYRVGLIGMNDNYTRNCPIAYTNVTNNANITGITHVGGFIGEAQGGGSSLGTKENAKLYFTNCVNNGNITATSGVAGGFAGSLNHLKNQTNYCVVTLDSCSNNGKITATSYAGGFIGGINNTVTLKGTNTNSGIITASTSNFYVGNIGSGTYSKETGAVLRTIYKLNFGVANQEFVVTATGATLEKTSYTTDEIGIAEISLLDIQNFSGVTLTVEVALLKTNPTITPTIANKDTHYLDAQYQKTMATFVQVPVSISLSSKNVYNTTSSGSNWVLKAVVALSDGTNKEIDLISSLTTEQLNTNQLVFTNVSFSHATYNVPDSFVQNLMRITADVETFVTNAHALISKTSGSNVDFLTLGTNAKTIQDKLTTELAKYGDVNNTRFINYIENNITNIKNSSISLDLLADYYANIVSSVDETALSDIAVDHGVYSFSKNVVFKKLDSSTDTKTLNFEFAKNASLTNSATSQTIELKVGNVVTYSYTKTIDIKINKLTLNVVFDYKEVVFDNTTKTLNVSLGALALDNVSYTLSYSGNESVKDVGTYEVSLVSISGDDAVYYNIPANYAKGTLKIKPIIVALQVEDGKEYDYNTEQQATAYTLVKQNESSYNLTSADHSVKYVSNKGTLNIKPTNAGDYTAQVSVGDNFEITGTNEFTFKINPIQITDIEIENDFTYCKQEPKFNYTKFHGALGDDKIKVTAYTIKQGDVENTGINAGTYKLYIQEIDNENYYITEISKEFTVKPKVITITLGYLTSMYGEPLELDNITYTTTDVIHTGDNLNIKAKELSDITVNTYPLEATYNNSNYDVTIIPNEYYISPRPLTISFGTKEYYYDSINRYDDIISEVEIVNTAFEDIKNMKFKLYQGEEWDSEVNSFENAGTYKLKLEAHDVLNNYTINQEEEIYKINPFAVEFVINKMTKIYNEVIEQKDYSIQEVSLYDDIANIATFNYVLHEKSEMSTFSLKTASASAVTTTKPDAGTYTINLELTDNGLLGNYDVTIIENELVVEQRETELKTENTSKFYDEQAMDFTAEVYGKKDQEKLDTNPTLEYTFTRDGQPTKEILLVGRYSILVRYSGDRNHIGTEKVFELEVKTNEITITDYVKEKVFDGEAFTPSYSYSMSKTVDIDSKIKCEITDLEGNSAEAINVGDYLIVLSIDDSGYKIDENTFKFNITKANVTATIDTVSIEYSVTFKPEDATYTCTTGNVEKDPIVLEYEIVDYNGAAGEYIINGKNKNDNYSVTVVPGKLIVSKKNIIVEYEGNDELVYSEQKYDDLCKANVSNYLTQNDYDVYYENIKHNKVEEVRDAGTYYLVVELKDTNNFTINSQEIDKLYKTIVVNIKVLSLKINIETQKTYDGKSIDVDSVYADENIVNSSIYSVNYYKNQINISAPNTYGDYVVEIVPQNANNYKFENNTKAFSILKRNVTIEPIAAEYTYTRAAIMPDLILNNVVTGDESKVYLSPEYVDNGGKFIEVGTYSINVLQLRGPSANNYNLITEETTLSYAIVQARANVNINNTIFPFTNTKITRDMLEITFESELSILDSDYTLSELPHETGDYSITFSSANNGIVFDISSFDICIQKGRIEGIVFEGKSVDFDNNTHTLYVNKLELENGIKLGAEYFNNSHKHAGSYHATVILKNKNYHDLTLTATLEINRIDLFIPVSAQTKYIYNGQRQGKDILGLENLWYSQLISYNYIGKDGSSILKPTNAGNYELQITALNEGDINITNTIQDNSFVIETKGLTLKNLDNQVYTYDGTSKQFNLIVTGQANQENPIISIKYEGSSLLPKDAGEYKVTFEKVAGALEDNYHIINGNETALLIINAKEITIKADEKSVVYGEAELPLTHSSVELCDGDALTGSIIREEGDYVRSYLISKGTLSAGKNYKIHFVPAYYNITARTITAKSFQTNFTYNGKQQIPEVEFNNVLAKDGKVVKVSAIGDTVNAGSYTLQFMLLDSNYVINEQTIYQISIDKQDITDNIIGLISTNKDYNGNRFEPIALISGGYKYVLSYKLNSSDVNEIRNAGTYDVKISIDDRNYKGEKTCKFTINKINYSIDIIDNIVVNVRSNGFDISGLDNIAVSSDGVNFNDGKVINGLQPKTSYNLFVEVKESENYKSTIFNLGNVSTCASAVILNEQIASLITQKIEFSNISQIKEILRDYEALSASEEAMIDDENLQSFVNQYNGYINELNREIENIRMASDIVNLESARKTRASLSVYASVLALGMLQFKKGKKKNEHKN